MAGNVEILRAGYEAFAKGDVQAVLRLFHPAIEWNEAEHVTYWTGGPFRGGDQIVAGVFARIAQDFDGFRIDVRRMVGLNDTVLVESRYRGIVKATGKALDAQVAHVWDFREGKIVRFQQYTDTWQFAEVTGVKPKR
jgi:ketosteroid isomerase-like protein